jgi:hypothetical protein
MAKISFAMGFVVRTPKSLPMEASANQIFALSDVELRLAIAREYLGFDRLHVRQNGDIIGSMSGVFTTVPYVAPDWTGDDGAAADLEYNVREDGLWTAYVEALTLVCGSAPCTARKRCEAVLMTVRSRTATACG